MYKTGTDGPHAQIKFWKHEIKQKSFRSNFERKTWNKIKIKLILNEIEVEINLKLSFKLILKFKLNMKVKYNFEIRIAHKNSLPIMGDKVFHYCHRYSLYYLSLFYQSPWFPVSWNFTFRNYNLWWMKD